MKTTVSKADEATHRNKQGYVAVTGATGAIGREIVRALLAENRAVLLLCRNEKRMEALIETLREEYPVSEIKGVVLDLEDELSVRACAQTISDRRITGLINNAGVMCRHYRLDNKGRELTLSVNYYNTALLAGLLLADHPELSSVVFTTSMTRRLRRHYRADEMPTVHPGQFSQLGTYALSKRLLTDHAARLARQYPARCINCADPGVVDTGMIHMDRWYDPLADLLFRPFIRLAAKGAEPTLKALHSTVTGRIFCRHLRYKLKGC